MTDDEPEAVDSDAAACLILGRRVGHAPLKLTHGMIRFSACHSVGRDRAAKRRAPRRCSADCATPRRRRDPDRGTSSPGHRGTRDDGARCCGRSTPSGPGSGKHPGKRARIEDVPMDVTSPDGSGRVSRRSRPARPPYVRIGRFPHIVPAFPERIREPDEVQMPALGTERTRMADSADRARTEGCGFADSPGARTTPAEIVLSTAKISHPVCQIGRPVAILL